MLRTIRMIRVLRTRLCLTLKEEKVWQFEVRSHVTQDLADTRFLRYPPCGFSKGHHFNFEPTVRETFFCYYFIIYFLTYPVKN